MPKLLKQKLMRKTLLIIFAIYGTLISQAQIPKNATLIGGQFSFSAQKKSNDGENWYRTNNSQNFSISAGKAFKENKVVGLSIGYSHNKQSYSDTIYQRFASYNAGIFYRQYAKLANRFYLFGQADLYCSFSKERTENYFNWDNDEKKKNWSSYEPYARHLIPVAKKCRLNLLFLT